MFMVDLEETIDCAVNYLIGDRSIFNKESPLFQKTFVAYLADKNSSTLREAVTLRILNYKKIDKKHGADGIHPVTGKYVEVKPQYAHLTEDGKQNYLGGGGTFNDIHYDKVKSCAGWDMVCSGFAEDKLIYIVRFPFDYLAPTLQKFIDDKIESNKKKEEGQTQGRFSTMFRYNQYVDCPDLEVVYFNKEHAQRFMSKKMYFAFNKKYND